MDQTNVDQLLDLIDVRVDAFAVCEIGKQFSLRCEPFDQVIVHFVLKGEGFLECEHGRFALAPGTVIIVPKRLRKRLSGCGPIEQVRNADAACPLEDGLVSFKAVAGEADLLLGCAALTATLGGELPIFAHVNEPVLKRSGDPTLQALFTAMLEELRHPRLGTRAFVSALMKQVIILLTRSVDGEASLRMPVLNARLAAAIAVVLQRPQDEHTVDSLAATVGMSRARFCHHFSSAYACSPKAFVQSARLASAARLLKGSDLPVKSVAASVGYASRSHFSRAFHHKYGLDPSAFRQGSRAAPQ